MSCNILINVTAFVFIYSVKINTFKLKRLIFVYELLLFLKFHRCSIHWTLFCVLQDMCTTVYCFILIFLCVCSVVACKGVPIVDSGIEKLSFRL